MDYRLARRSGISHAVISKARRGKLPRWDACYALATALQVPPETRELMGLFDPLPPVEQTELIQIARLKLTRQAVRPITRVSGTPGR